MFHQGITDIINSVALINTFSEQIHVILITREELQSFIEFFCKNRSNITYYYESMDIFRNIGELRKKYKFLLNDPKVLIKTFGMFDVLRDDEYNNAFTKNNHLFFVDKFYANYDLNPLDRINHFVFERDPIIEELFFDKISPPNSYIIVHQDVKRNLLVRASKGVLPWINIDGISSNFFEAIKLLEKASEIHCIDSCWAAFIYIIDAKYGIFQHIPITVHCLRGYRRMFSLVNLSNWNIL